MPDTKRDVLHGLEGYAPGPWEAGTVALRWPSTGEGPNFSDGDWEVYPPLGESGPVAICPSAELAHLIARAPELVEEIRELRKALRGVIAEADRETVAFRHARALLPDTEDDE